ncbi:MAG: hypothetical protein K6C12_02845 [Oscillospiraceae bacterium]|nr:hypothetical protein [Oscillospiraceae bacterium]
MSTADPRRDGAEIRDPGSAQEASVSGSSVSGARTHLESRGKASRSAVLQERNVRRPARLGPPFRPQESGAPAASDGPASSDGSAAVPDPGFKTAEKRFRRFGLIQWLLLLLQLVLMGLLVFALFRLRRSGEPAPLEIRYLVPGQEDLVETVTWGDPVLLHDPVELDGYTFLFWADEEGNPETRSSFPLYRSRYYTARYAVQLETGEHVPYLSLDKNGIVDIDAPVTVREGVLALYRLLNTDLVGEGRFEDVPEKDPCYLAAATLKSLGILQGERLYPDERLTRTDLLRMFCSFYPESTEPASFSDLSPEDTVYPVFRTAAARGWIESGPDIPADPDGSFTKGDFARTVNRILGRPTLQRPSEAEVGTLLDVPASHPYYDDVIEAVIPHDWELTDGCEVWSASTPLPVHAPGTFFVGSRMHIIGEDGRAVADRSVEGRYFNRSGELSTRDAELDRLLWDFMDDWVVPARMTQDEMLPILYKAVWSSFKPTSGYVYPLDSTDWLIPEAKRTLTEGSASSYGYAAVFYELCYLIDVPDARPVSGMIYGTQTDFRTPEGKRIETPSNYMPHGWVEILYNGISYIFDPDSDARSYGQNMMFHKNEPIRWQAGYRTW